MLSFLCDSHSTVIVCRGRLKISDSNETRAYVRWISLWVGRIDFCSAIFAMAIKSADRMIKSARSKVSYKSELMPKKPKSV